MSTIISNLGGALQNGIWEGLTNFCLPFFLAASKIKGLRAEEGSTDD